MIEIDNILDVEKYLDRIDAVIFDLDDTLYSEKDYVKSGYHAIADAFPQIPAMYDELWKAFENHEPAIDTVFAKYHILSCKNEALRVYRHQKPNISLYPGVRTMLDRIEKSRKLGIITDGRPEGQRAKLTALGLLDIPSLITDELGGTEYRKPCPKAFEILCREFGVCFAAAVYIGDNKKKDFIAPEQLGMKTIYFKNKDGLYRE